MVDNTRLHGTKTDGTGEYDRLITDNQGRLIVVAEAQGGAGPTKVEGDGTAGTPSGGVLSVQGVAGGTALPTSSAQLPASLGAKTGATSLSVVPATDAEFPTSISNRALFWPETSTPLAASATFNGASRDVGVASPGPAAFDYFNAMIYADQIGTATIERSDDAAAWTPAATGAIEATTPLTLQVPVTARYHRIVVENGGTLQTVLSVNSSYTT